MKYLQYLFIYFALLTISFVTAFGEVSASKAREAMQVLKKEGRTDPLYQLASDHSISTQDLSPFIDDENEQVRIFVYTAVAIRGAYGDVVNDRDSVLLLMRGINDPSETVRNYVASILSRSPANMFAPDSHAAILESMKSFPSAEFFRLAGAAEVTDAMEVLRNLKNAGNNDPGIIDAMARLGDAPSIRAIISDFTGEANDYKRLTRQLPRLIYVSRPETLKLVDAILVSDRKIKVPGSHGYRMVSEGAFAANELCKYVPGVPIRKHPLVMTQDELGKVREWWKLVFVEGNLVMDRGTRVKEGRHSAPAGK